MPTATVLEFPAPKALRAYKHPYTGRKYPIEPMRDEDFARLLAACVPQGAGRRYVLGAARLRAMYVMLYRSGIRISEALDLVASDLDRAQGAVLVRNGKGGKRRLAAMDPWAWEEIVNWIAIRDELKPGALFPVITGPSIGRPWEAADVRRQFRENRDRAGLRTRCNPHSCRHGFAISLWRETHDLLAVQHALGHSSAVVTEIYLSGIGELEALAPVVRRSAPKILIPHLAV